jgi:pre-mRNA-splicing factor ATP-dependent RNA helicase DHX38/PRP16
LSLVSFVNATGTNNLNIGTDWDETQSTRGENPNRPPSSGYGGPVGGGNVPGNPPAGAASGYAAGQAENATELLSQGHAMNASDHDATGAYGYPSAVATGHNGISNENF